MQTITSLLFKIQTSLDEALNDTVIICASVDTIPKRRPQIRKATDRRNQLHVFTGSCRRRTISDYVMKIIDMINILFLLCG
jgi:hypothetical protein